MGLFSFLTPFRSKPPVPGAVAPEKARTEAASASAPPRRSSGDGRAGRKDGHKAAQAGKPATPPSARTAATSPAGGKAAPPGQARGADTRAPVPPVGARGETDLAARDSASGKTPFPSVQGSADDVDRESIRELFSEIAASQVTPVLTFIGELRANTATKEWLEICRPVMAVLVESATSLGLGEISRPMTDFTSALDLAGDGGEGPIDAGARELLLESFDVMARALPEAFAQVGTPKRRDTMLLHALLKQVPGVGLVTIDRLYAAGLTSLEPMYGAHPAELAVTTGVPASLCQEICNKLREHRMEIEQTSHLPAEQRFGARLRGLLNELIRVHDEFEQFAESGGFDGGLAERKRIARRSRSLCALKIEATLVEMGEIEQADRLRTLSFSQRISVLVDFLGIQLVKRAAERR